MLSSRRMLGSLAAALVAAGMVAAPAGADHSWGSYHWARTNNPFTLQLGDNVSAAWDSYLATTSTDWTLSTVLDTTIVAGNAGSPKRCRATSGRVEVCSATYGKTGWLGVASVWASGSHITQSTVKVNDTYFNTATYNTSAWRNLVMCQEVGHAFGLDHQDEAFENPNLGTCMDYTSNPSGPPTNEHPNDHDYDQLVTIYQHTDSTTTVASSTATSGAEGGNGRSEWGRAIRTSSDGRTSVFVRELAGRERVFTFVVWAS